MASGYEKSTDYGGREPRLWVVILQFTIFLAAILAFVLWAWSRAHAGEALSKNERYYQRLYCGGMSIGPKVTGGGLADCVSQEYAIEVDYADKWAESIGQALYYAKATGKRPGIILLCPSSSTHQEGRCRAYTYRLFDALDLVRTPVQVWMCYLDTDRRLSDCIQPKS